MAYSTTLKRYLFCPSCPQESNDVYAYIREDTDPLSVKDLHELVRSWRNIVTDQIEPHIFPCADCPEQTACYGKTALSNTRVVPFIFYPSYILAFDANSMSATDFLPLISGAAIDEIVPPLKEKNQYGRINNLLEWQQIHGSGDLFLYSGKAEQFLEILYLKLSFLTDVARIILAPGTAPMPLDITTAIDCLWVNLPNHNSLLPGLWNFKINLFTVGSCETDADSLPISHPSQTCYYLGIIWFFALLRNKNQSVPIIQEALNQIFKRPAESVSASELPEFAPENIFWNPDAHQPKDIPEEWRIIWAHAVSLGEHLLQGKYPEKMDDSKEKFFADLESIRQELKQLLFYKEKETGPGFSKQITDAEIHRILSRMLGRWQTDKKPPAPPLETLTQTVILSVNTASDLSKSVEATTEKIKPSRSTEEEIQETVILKTNATSPTMTETIPNTHPSGGTATNENAEEEIQETVILKANATPPIMPEAVPDTQPSGGGATNEKNDLPETLILKPSYIKNKNHENK